MTEPVRLGGMALANGVLVHGPGHWACAVRLADGRLELASGRKAIRSAEVRSPLLRVPARVAEVLALLPEVRRALPAAELPFAQVRVLAAFAGTTAVVRGLRSSGLSAGAQEAFAVLLTLVPASVALRGTDVAAYHGAEHIAIGSYEHGEPRPREHERCGSHMLAPLLVLTAAGNVLAGKLARTAGGRAAARTLGGAGALAAAGELYGWALRHPDRPLARALAWPGTTLQSRLLTAEPAPEQLEVARAALEECLRLEAPPG
ncbi:MAG: DUF1385 domain-containing protein [Thermoleophilia bacterium]|nr:DUF1385 domain-containing protein [Thermoleophilia bacterium]